MAGGLGGSSDRGVCEGASVTWELQRDVAYAMVLYEIWLSVDSVVLGGKGGG